MFLDLFLWCWDCCCNFPLSLKHFIDWSWKLCLIENIQQLDEEVFEFLLNSLAPDHHWIRYKLNRGNNSFFCIDHSICSKEPKHCTSECYIEQKLDGEVLDAPPDIHRFCCGDITGQRRWRSRWIDRNQHEEVPGIDMLQFFYNFGKSMVMVIV